jgi:hypothetical protein
MSSPDRVAVPTNGHRPALQDDALEAPSVEADDGASARPAPSVGGVTPGQLIAGFGVIAALVLLLVGRRRSRG